MNEPFHISNEYGKHCSVCGIWIEKYGGVFLTSIKKTVHRGECYEKMKLRMGIFEEKDVINALKKLKIPEEKWKYWLGGLK